ncbi:hypothetical protein BKA62DRAFT_697096 [Auriculariales sp. MPI-PUGE-AT-0066]|nr:hypothetical protein BKA62DRAFT_697096 [Auriculariales sp. MPI-PUGE-AT-0066]
MGSIFSAIGNGINAIISAIANVIMTIVSVITNIIVSIFDCLTCGKCGTRRSTTTSSRRGWGSRRTRAAY